MKVRGLYIPTSAPSARRHVSFHSLFIFQLKAKRSECNSKATHARNDYLLTLAAANAHQRRYYDTDLLDCIKVRTSTLRARRQTCAGNLKMCFLCAQVLDGRIYEQVKDYLVSLCQTELEGYQTVYNTFSHLLNRSNGVSGFFIRVRSERLSGPEMSHFT